MTRRNKLKRMFKFWWQRRTRGFDDRDLWNLDATIALFILPRLKAFREQSGCYPVDMGNMGEWLIIIDKIQEALTITANNVGGLDCQWQDVDANLLLLGKHFRDLWS